MPAPAPATAPPVPPTTGPAAVSDADRDLLARLNRRGRAGIEELCEELGVTATAVRQRLSRLQAGGLIDRAPVNVGRGRPKHLYGLTPAGRRSLGSNYRELADAMWSALSEIEDPKLRAALFARLQDHLVARYGGDAGDDGAGLAARLGGLRDALRDYGYAVEMAEENGRPVLREHHCPYLDIAEDDPALCELEQRVFERVLGTGVELTRCCRDGDACCEFTPVDAAAAAGPLATVQIDLPGAAAGVTP